MSSRFGTRRVRLFRFAYQSKVWRFAQSTVDIEAGGYTWLAATIERDDIRLTAESAKDKLSVRFAYLRDPAAPLSEIPVTQSLDALWQPWIPTDYVFVMCLEYVVGSDDPPDVQWMGVVAQPRFPSDVQIELTCKPGNTAAESPTQGPMWQVGCWKRVYSQGLRGCNLVEADYETSATLTAVDGLTLTADNFAVENLAKPFTLLTGEAKWTDSDGLVHRRMITDHTGNTIRIHFAGPELAPGLEVVVKPACEQTFAACEARENTDNHGGAAYMPVTDPDKDSMSW